VSREREGEDGIPETEYRIPETNFQRHEGAAKELAKGDELSK